MWISGPILLCDVLFIDVTFVYIVGATLSCEVCCVGDWYEIELIGIFFQSMSSLDGVLVVFCV